MYVRNSNDKNMQKFQFQMKWVLSDRIECEQETHEKYAVDSYSSQNFYLCFAHIKTLTTFSCSDSTESAVPPIESNGRRVEITLCRRSTSLLNRESTCRSFAYPHCQWFCVNLPHSTAVDHTYSTHLPSLETNESKNLHKNYLWRHCEWFISLFLIQLKNEWNTAFHWLCDFERKRKKKMKTEQKSLIKCVDLATLQLRMVSVNFIAASFIRAKRKQNPTNMFYIWRKVKSKNKN